MIYNFAFAVKDIKHSTLINSWKKLLINEDIEPDTAELETEDFPIFSTKEVRIQLH